MRCYGYRAPKAGGGGGGGGGGGSGSNGAAAVPVNADFEAGLVRQSAYNSRTPSAAPALLEKAEDALPYVNMLGQIALPRERSTRQALDELRAAVAKAKAVAKPAY